MNIVLPADGISSQSFNIFSTSKTATREFESLVLGLFDRTVII